jgi:hypothetical protein
LINQILFVSDVPDQQIGHEHVAKCSFAVNHVHHGFLLDSHYRAIGHRACGTHPEGLSGKATLSEKVALVLNSYCGFLPARRQYGELYLPSLDIEDGIGRIALSKDFLLFRESRNCSTVVNGREEGLRIEFPAFLDRRHGCHGSLPFNAKGRPRTPVLDRAHSTRGLLWSATIFVCVLKTEQTSLRVGTLLM